MRLVELLVRYSWANRENYLPLITTAINNGIGAVEDSYLTTKMLKAMGCEL